MTLSTPRFLVQSYHLKVLLNGDFFTQTVLLTFVCLFLDIYFCLCLIDTIKY